MLLKTITVPNPGLFQIVTYADFMIPSGCLQVAKHPRWTSPLLNFSSD